MEEIKNITVPNFGVGQIEGVDSYVDSAIERLCHRNNISGAEKDRLVSDLLNTLGECKRRMSEVLSQAMVHALPQSRILWRTLGDIFIGSESKLKGKVNFDEALGALERGDNVLLISNHTSGADTLLMETLIMREYGYDVLRDAVYMSGHAVNLYLIPFLVSSCVNRLQIFSTKYRSMAVSSNGILQDTGSTESEMRTQNLHSLRALNTHARNGGKLVGLYPEGGRGEGQLKSGEPNTTCIPDIMSKSGKPLFILPVYVEDVINILPVRRNDNEYNEYLEHINRGSGTVSIGRMVSWQSVCSVVEKQDSVRGGVLGTIGFPDGDEVKNMKTALMMSLIADLAPEGKKRGVYGHEKVRAASANLLQVS